MTNIAIETSGLAGSIALFEGRTCLAERVLELGRRHGQSLVPEIGRIVQDAGRRLRDCELLAVSVGPGSFTGLRVGVVCAKTFAYATGCRIVAVDTHQAIAANTPTGIASVQIVGHAQLGDVIRSRLVRGADGRWLQPEPPQFLPAAAWIDSLHSDDVVSGFERAALGEFADLWSLEPLYLRRSSAEEKWDLRRAARERRTSNPEH